MKTVARLFVGALMSVLACSALAEDDWKLVKEDKRNNIKLYLRQEAGMRTKSFRLVGSTKGSIDKYTEVMLDIPRMCEWMYRCKEVKKLKQIGNSEQYVYFLYDAPYGLEDRDVIVNGVYHFDKSKGFLRTRSDLNYLPPTPGVVRMTRYDIELSGREVGDELELSMEGNIDPGGKVPLWAVNLVQLDGPYSTIKKLMRIVRKEEAAEEREETAREREREREQARRRERSRDDDAERDSKSAEKELAKRGADKEREPAARPSGESKPAPTTVASPAPIVATPATAEPVGEAPTEPAPSSAASDSSTPAG